MAKKKIPMKDWVVERPFDSADYLDGPPPRKMTPEETKRFRSKKKRT